MGKNCGAITPINSRPAHAPNSDIAKPLLDVTHQNMLEAFMVMPVISKLKDAHGNKVTCACTEEWRHQKGRQAEIMHDISEAVSNAVIVQSRSSCNQKANTAMEIIPEAILEEANTIVNTANMIDNLHMASPHVELVEDNTTSLEPAIDDLLPHVEDDLLLAPHMGEDNSKEKENTDTVAMECEKVSVIPALEEESDQSPMEVDEMAEEGKNEEFLVDLVSSMDNKDSNMDNKEANDEEQQSTGNNPFVSTVVSTL